MTKEERKVYRKEYYEKNKEKHKEYREKNKEKIKEYKKEYRDTNKEKIREENREYRDKNKEHIREQKREYRATNIEAIKEHKKQYYEKNKEYYQTPQHKRAELISSWRSRGIIGDLPTIYDERYLPSTACEVCNKTYSSTFDRCLDHCHETGEFRQMLCRSCNTRDNWKKIVETQT